MFTVQLLAADVKHITVPIMLHTASPLDLLSFALRTGLLVSAPILLVVLIVGLLVNIVQVATQIQDASVSFVPKLIVAGIALMLLAPWMLRRLVMFATEVISSIALIG